MSEQTDPSAALRELLTKQATQAASEADSGRTEAARKRAAKDWVSHYVYIAGFRQELIDTGVVTADEFTQTLAETLLLDKWNDKAEVRAEKPI